MSLEAKSQALKEIVATYDAQWFLGHVSFIMHAGKEKAKDQLGNLSSPMRQLYYLAGLNISSDPVHGTDIMYTPEKWNQMVKLLNEIESEYDKLFQPGKAEDVTDEWKRIRMVAMPSFLSYFNQGPLNYEEQVIRWVSELFTPLDNIIENATGLKTKDFLLFYETLDKLHQRNFQAHSTNKDLLRRNWKDYTNIKMGVPDEVPDFIKEMGEQNAHLYSFMADHGMIDRFFPAELVTVDLAVDKVQIILSLLSITRIQTDFLYYTATKPGNPLYEKPIINIDRGLFQVFEVKQVIHAIENLLEEICCSNTANTTKYTSRKGALLENRVVELFSGLFKADFKVYQGYFVDGCEQDLLILWKKYAFIIEAKGYSLREPLRDPSKAFVRIKKDFEASIGYGYKQTRRVEQKFIDCVPLRLTDSNGNLIEEIDTTKYDEDFSIIVNLESFGQVQNDLSTLITLENEDDLYPWAVKLDDLEIFILTLIAKNKKPIDLVNFLLMREELHGKLICSDELEVCGGFLTKHLNQKQIKRADTVVTTPELGDVFDKQYYKGLGLKNEKYLKEKQDGTHIIW